MLQDHRSVSQDPVRLAVAAGFSPPLSVAIPREVLDDRLEDVIRAAVRDPEVAREPGAAEIGMLLGRDEAPVWEYRGRYFRERETRPRDVLGDQEAAQEQQQPLRLMTRQRGGSAA